MKYVSEEFISTDFSTDRSFGELEIYSTLALIKEYKQNQVYNIGVGGSLYTVPVVHGSMLIFGANDKNLYALDIGTGKELWRFPANHIVSFPEVHGDKIYFASHDMNFYCVSLEGKKIWSYPTNGMLFSYNVFSDGLVFFGSEDGNLYALDAETGRLAWKFRTGGPLSEKIVLWKGRLYFGSWDRNIYCVSTEGRLLWKRRESFVVCSPAVNNGRLLFGTRDGVFRCLSCGDGKELWNFKISGTLPSDPPSSYGERAYFTSYNGNLYCLSMEGKLLWKFHTNDITAFAAVETGDSVYFGSCDGNLYALTLDGKLRWKFRTDGPVMGSLLLRDGMLYFGSWDCNLYAITTEGRLAWKFRTSMSSQSRIDVQPNTLKRDFEIIVQGEEKREKEKKYETEDTRDLEDYSMKSLYVSDIGYKSKSKYGK